jgi:hypothetical protein
MRRLPTAWTFTILLFAGACHGGQGASDPLAKKQYVDGPAPDAAPAPSEKLSEAECSGLFDHLVKLMQEGMPPDEWAAGKDDLAAEREGMIKDCQDGETTRAQYDCLMRASELAQIPDCVPAK